MPETSKKRNPRQRRRQRAKRQQETAEFMNRFFGRPRSSDKREAPTGLFDFE